MLELLWLICFLNDQVFNGILVYFYRIRGINSNLCVCCTHYRWLTTNYLLPLNTLNKHLIGNMHLNKLMYVIATAGKALNNIHY